MFIDRISNNLARRREKWEKEGVLYELETFAYHISGLDEKQISVREAYRLALEDPLKFRRVLDREVADFWPLKGDGELPVSDSEKRYYRRRGLPVPPLF